MIGVWEEMDRLVTNQDILSCIPVKTIQDIIFVWMHIKSRTGLDYDK